MTGSETMLPDLRDLLAALTHPRLTAWFGVSPENRAALRHNVARLRARIAHLEGLPQRTKPPERR